MQSNDTISLYEFQSLTSALSSAFRIEREREKGNKIRTHGTVTLKSFNISITLIESKPERKLSFQYLLTKKKKNRKYRKTKIYTNE